MERKRILQWVFLVAVVLVLVGAVGLTLAQGPGADGVLPQGEVNVAASLDDVIPIQGRLLDANGNPINGTRRITMTLYDAATGAQRCAPTATTLPPSTGCSTRTWITVRRKISTGGRCGWGSRSAAMRR